MSCCHRGCRTAISEHSCRYNYLLPSPCHRGRRRRRRQRRRSSPPVTALAVLLLVVTLICVGILPSANAIGSSTAGGGCKLELLQGRVYVGGNAWLTLGRPCVRRNGGVEVCEVDWDLVRRDMDFSSAVTTHGYDTLGPYKEVAHATQLDDKWTGWEIAARRYEKDKSSSSSSLSSSSTTGDGGAEALIFEQRFIDKVTGSAVPAPSVQESAKRGLASWFPAFSLVEEDGGDKGNSTVRGVIRYSGAFMGAGYKIEPWRLGPGGGELSRLDALSGGGPVVLFSDECSLVLSPSSSFMSSGVFYDEAKDELGFGVLGSVDEIPRGHSTATILSASSTRGIPDGIRQSLTDWGAKLMTLHGTQRTKNDVTLENLQFSTDNGAYYYYQTEKGMTYQDTIIHVKRTAESRGIPFRQWLMDSWWYYKGRGNGVKNWTAMPSIFPDGITAVRDATRWDVVAHNRYFASDTDYAHQNGGDYDFVVEGDMALPVEQRFWDDLFADAKLWGLTTYEQDWLYNTFAHFNYTLQSVTAGRDWLVQMGKAASQAGINIQYCMSWPRHILQSLEVPAVSQARASDDYQPGYDGNWMALGVTSMFGHALGLTPTKDNFWSYSGTENTSHYGNRTEPASRLHAVISTLSTGPVAPSDRVDLMDAQLILRSCNSAGRLLRPDAPAVRTDTTLLAEAGIPVTSAQRGQVWSTWSSLAELRYTYILAAGSPAFSVDIEDVYQSPQSLTNGEFVAWEPDLSFKPLGLPIQVHRTTKVDFHFYCIAPIFGNGWAFLGEAESKWISVSKGRFSGLLVTEHGFSLNVAGDPGEQVEVIFRSPDEKFHRAACFISSFGSIQFSSALMGCGPRSSSPSNNFKRFSQEVV